MEEEEDYTVVFFFFFFSIIAIFIFVFQRGEDSCAVVHRGAREIHG
jgi:hypothetical protein